GEPGGGEIHVDLSGLRDFARELRTGVSGVLSQYDPVSAAFSAGAGFGSGGAMGADRCAPPGKNHGCRVHGAQASGSFLDHAHTLSAAVERIADAYGNVDWTASATAKNIEDMFNPNPSGVVS